MKRNLGTIKQAEEKPVQLTGKLRYPIKRKSMFDDTNIDMYEVPADLSMETAPAAVPEPVIVPITQNDPNDKSNYTFNITLPEISVHVPAYIPPSITINNEVLPTPITVQPSEVSVAAPIINVQPSEVVVQSAPAPVVNVKNIVKMQPDPEPTNLSVRRDELGNIVGIEES